MIGGRDTTVALSGGVQPYHILQSPKSNIATTSLENTTISIRSAFSEGHGSILVGDSAPTQNTVTIQINVVLPP